MNLLQFLCGSRPHMLRLLVPTGRVADPGLRDDQDMNQYCALLLRWKRSEEYGVAEEWWRGGS